MTLQPDSKALQNIKRRRLLRGGVIAGLGALTIGFLPGCALPVIPKRPKAELSDAAGWIRYDGTRYQLFIPRVEMGQNILTALKQVACMELGVTWDQVDAQLHNTQLARVRATVGSESIKDFALPLVQACASLREAVARGLTQAQMSDPALLKPNERPLASLRAFSKPLTIKDPRLEHAHEIVTGAALFVADIVLPDMKYGRVLRAPGSPDSASQPKKWNESAARAISGFVSVVQSPLLLSGQSLGLGVIAKTPSALDKITAALNVEWSIDNQPNAAKKSVESLVDIDTRIKSSIGRSNKVHSDKITTDLPWDIDLKIDVPLAAHAPIEPRACVARFNAKGDLDVWVGSQDVFYQRDVICIRLGLPESKVNVQGMRVGGAFGGKTICTVELETAVLLQALFNDASNNTANRKTVALKIQWTRAQEFQWGFHRPPSSHRIRARLKKDGSGRVALDQWWHQFASSHILFTNAVLPSWMQKVTNVIGDDGVARGSQLVYQAAAKRTEFDLVRLPVFTGPWRGLGAAPNTFAIESAIDECALLANTDPLQFRLNNLQDERLTKVLKRVAQISSWGNKPAQSGSNLVGRGVACGIYKSASYVAVVADVEVNRESGTVKVKHLWCVHDCGIVINADQVKAQCEGNLIWGIGMVLKEQLAANSAGVTAISFAQSPIPTMAEVPPMTIDLIDDQHPPTGAGETAIVAAGAAIANAVRAATGYRLQQLPLNSLTLVNHLKATK
jgi:isoquinoline 1-oxidoreductase subunit beta